MLSLYNSLTKQKEPFTPIAAPNVGLYTCGPTVYHYAHIGNLRTYVFEDLLRRTLRMNGYTVNHVMNITDVGHLTDDGDNGEDKMEKGAKREGKTAWDVAAFYTEAFQNDIAALNILEPHVWCKATDHIPEQVAMVETLLEKGFAYYTSDGIYFDTSKVSDYGKLVDLDKQTLQAGIRVDMGEKKHEHDFALWKWSPEGTTRHMEWDAFLKKGFPGWHIECSAMSRKYLGDHFDIHCGGVDHKPVHHTNEIAQTESVTGKKPWVNVWMHGEFLLIDSGTNEEDKMSKSGDNFITLSTLIEKGYDPLAYRYFLLQAHYRKQLTFKWEALDAATQGLINLRKQVANLDSTSVADPKIHEAFQQALNNDLNAAEALAILSRSLKEKTIDIASVIAFDKVLGLELHTIAAKAEPLPQEILLLAKEREQARKEKNWAASDEIRDKLVELGFSVEDTAEGQHIQWL
ncbi:MAG: cysteine--tRNA ligase [Candidatus Magasanikbacteria bacterium]|nr:cysteine--tRNA ligase [Candidatus Magasanikbacteria bacterium]